MRTKLSIYKQMDGAYTEINAHKPDTEVIHYMIPVLGLNEQTILGCLARKNKDFCIGNVVSLICTHK